MKKIKINTAEKELYYKGEVIVRYSIEYPEIISPIYQKSEQAFNHENRKNALELKEFAEGELYEEAKRAYEYNKKNGYPIIIYEFIKNCNLFFN